MANKEGECTCAPSSNRAQIMRCSRLHDSVMLLPLDMSKRSPEAVLAALKAVRDTLAERPSPWKEFCENLAHLEDAKRRKVFLREAIHKAFDDASSKLDDSRESEEYLLRILNKSALKFYKAMRQEDYNRLQRPEMNKHIAELEKRVAVTEND